MRFEMGEGFTLIPLQRHPGDQAVATALAGLAVVLEAWLAPLIVGSGEEAGSGLEEPLPERLAGLLSLPHWIRLGSEMEGLTGRRTVHLDSIPVFEEGTWLEADRGRTELWAWSRFPDGRGPHALCFSGGELQLSVQPVLPGHKPAPGRMTRLDLVDGSWATLDPDIFLGARPGPDLEMWDPCTDPSGHQVCMHVTPDPEGVRLVPSRPVRVRFVGLGLPRTIRQATRVVCRTLPGAPETRLRLLDDGVVDLSGGLRTGRVPERVGIEIALDLVVDGTPQTACYDCEIPVELPLDSLVPLAGSQPLEYPGDGSRVDGVRFHCPVRPPDELSLHLSSPAEETSRHTVRTSLATWKDGVAFYRATGLGRALSSFPTPGEVMVGCAWNPVLGRIALGPSAVPGRWVPAAEGAVRFQPMPGPLRVTRLEFPEADDQGRTRWTPVIDLEATLSAIFRARCHAAEFPGTTFCPPVEGVDTGMVRLIDLSEAGGSFWSRASSPSLELLVPEAEAYTATVWIPPFQGEHVPCEPTRNRLRVMLPAHLLEGMSGTGARIWIGDGVRQYRWFLWCRGARRPPGVWVRCRGAATVAVPSGPLFVDFQGLTSSASLQKALGASGDPHHLLVLDEPWDVSGSGLLGKDAAALAPIQGAVQVQDNGATAHYWIRAPGHGPPLLHLVLEHLGRSWSLRAAPVSDSDVTHPTLRRFHQDPAGKRWEVHPVWAGEVSSKGCTLAWGGLLVTLTPPPDPGVAFLGWTWIRGAEVRFPLSQAETSYGLVAARDRAAPAHAPTSRNKPDARDDRGRLPVLRVWSRED